jgi:hypothetical protein
VACDLRDHRKSTTWTMALFLATVVLGLMGMWASTRPAAVERVEEQRRRRAA